MHCCNLSLTKYILKLRCLRTILKRAESHPSKLPPNNNHYLFRIPTRSSFPNRQSMNHHKILQGEKV